MTVSLGDAIKNGVGDIASRNGVIFIALFTLLYLVYDVALDTTYAGLGMSQVSDLAIASSLGIGVSLLAVYLIATVYLVLVVLRTFTAGETDNVPESLYKDNILIPALNLVVGSIVFSVLVFLGVLAFILPGLFLLVVLYFYSFEIAAQDKNFVQALKGSYSLTKGNRVELFALGVTVTIAAAVVGIVGTPLMFVAQLSGLAGTIAALTAFNILLSTVMVATFSIAAQAYNQLLAINE